MRNSTSPYKNSDEPIQYKGIGLKNVQRRLALLYEGKHALQVQQNNESYHVTLSLALSQEQAVTKQVPEMNMSFASYS